MFPFEKEVSIEVQIVRLNRNLNLKKVQSFCTSNLHSQQQWSILCRVCEAVLLCCFCYAGKMFSTKRVKWNQILYIIYWSNEVSLHRHRCNPTNLIGMSQFSDKVRPLGIWPHWLQQRGNTTTDWCQLVLLSWKGELNFSTKCSKSWRASLCLPHVYFLHLYHKACTRSWPSPHNVQTCLNTTVVCCTKRGSQVEVQEHKNQERERLFLPTVVTSTLPSPLIIRATRNLRKQNFPQNKKKNLS